MQSDPNIAPHSHFHFIAPSNKFAIANWAWMGICILDKSWPQGGRLFHMFGHSAILLVFFVIAASALLPRPMRNP